MKKNTYIEVDKLVSFTEKEEKLLRKCSCCGKFKPIGAYNSTNDNNKPMERTNCYDCYMLPFEEMQELKAITREKESAFQHSKEYKAYSQKSCVDYFSISVEDLINQLKNLPKGSKVVLKDYSEENCGNLEKISISELDNRYTNLFDKDCEYYTLN